MVGIRVEIGHRRPKTLLYSLYRLRLWASCKSRACSSCGMKATERWIQKQQHVFPECEYQHITFTLPNTLWSIFRHNRWLLNKLFKCAANILLGRAKEKGIDIGIFCALHTYGRKLNWNTHLHFSVTRGVFVSAPVYGNRFISK